MPPWPFDANKGHKTLFDHPGRLYQRPIKEPEYTGEVNCIGLVQTKTELFSGPARHPNGILKSTVCDLAVNKKGFELAVSGGAN